MRRRVTDQGVRIPKDMLQGIDVVEIRKEPHAIIVVPVEDGADPIFGLGSRPVSGDIQDGSVHHDRYLTHH